MILRYTIRIYSTLNRPNFWTGPPHTVGVTVMIKLNDIMYIEATIGELYRLHLIDSDMLLYTLDTVHSHIDPFADD